MEKLTQKVILGTASSLNNIEGAQSQLCFLVYNSIYVRTVFQSC